MVRQLSTDEHASAASELTASVAAGDARREPNQTAITVEGSMVNPTPGVPLIGAALTWTAHSARATVRRVIALTSLLDRAGSALDDIAELRRSAQFIAHNLTELSKSAAGIDQNSAEIAREITGLTKAAQGIDTQAERLTAEINTVSQIMPTLQRLTDLVDPLDNTVVRLGRFVDRLPGGRRSTARSTRSKQG